MKINRLALASIILAITALIICSSNRPGRASTLCVNPGGTGGCQSSIQAAVSAANPGDTIDVAAGTYTELVTVNKQVTLRGANAGIGGCNGARVAESIVQGDSGKTAFNVTANNVVIDGFTVQGTTNGNQFGFGILLGAGTSGAQILNNIVQNNIAGLSMANNPNGNQATIQANNFTNNNQPGPVSGTAIYTDQFNAGGNLSNVLIDNNCFTNNQNGGVILGSTNAASQSNVTISGNTFSNEGNSILLFDTTSSTITQNMMTGSLGSQLVLGGGVSGLQITKNLIENGATRGIRIGSLGGVGANSSVTVNCNIISSNATAGLEIATISDYSGSLDATKNFWGSATGPTIASNPGGTGDKIIDPATQVVYNPFLKGPTVTCPANISVGNDPGKSTAVVTFSASASDLCDGPITPVCKIGNTVITSPHTFPSGTTTVTCSASDSFGLAGMCSFTVTVSLSVDCIQDDHTGDTLSFNLQTGAYTYTRCRDKFTLSGTGAARIVNGIASLTDSRADRRISAGLNLGQLTGRASLTLRVAPGVSQTFTINQSNPHPTCACP